MRDEATDSGFAPAIACTVDLTERCEVEQMVKTVLEEFGQIDVLVNCAGWDRLEPFIESHEETWDKIIAVNFKSVLHTTKAVLPHMIAQSSGKIVNIASHQAFKPGFGIANYAASKAALIGLTRAAAVDLGSAGINVNAVAPGFVKTELLTQLPREVLERAEHESVLGRVAEPEDVSRVILFLCSEAARHITGQVIGVDGGLP